jgi:hypothetical protein
MSIGKCLLKIVITALLSLAQILAAYADTACPSERSRFEYRSIDLGSKSGVMESDSFAIDLGRSVHWRGHSGLRLATCGVDEEQYCFHSSALSFSIPKKLPSINSSWQNGDYVYTAIESTEIQLLGLRIPAILIESNEAGNRFLYSGERGLLGIHLEAISSGAKTFWSISGLGFPFALCD